MFRFNWITQRNWNDWEIELMEKFFLLWKKSVSIVRMHSYKSQCKAGSSVDWIFLGCTIFSLFLTELGIRIRLWTQTTYLTEFSFPQLLFLYFNLFFTMCVCSKHLHANLKISLHAHWKINHLNRVYIIYTRT